MLPEYTIAFRTGRKRSNSGLEETLTREQGLPCTNGPPYHARALPLGLTNGERRVPVPMGHLRYSVFRLHLLLQIGNIVV